MITKRFFDLFFSTTGLIILLPVFLFLMIWIKFRSPGPIFFRQVRVGQFGVPFAIYKFRTMVVEAEKLGKQLTVGNDIRITSCGRVLRKYKLDELPQLINVLIGEMSLVGPRPEVPRYVAEYPADVRDIVLSVPPGITDMASIEYRDEYEILCNAQDPEEDYIQKILPVKLGYYVRYVNERSLWLDFKLIIATILAVGADRKAG